MPADPSGRISDRLDALGGADALRKQKPRSGSGHRGKETVFLPGDSDHVEEDISNALIYVLPSDTEGLPNALMEAMALGLPVISTDCPCGGPKSIIDDGINGILVPVKDVDRMAQAMKRLLEDGSLRQNIGREAREILKTNELSKIVDQWKEIIR